MSPEYDIHVEVTEKKRPPLTLAGRILAGAYDDVLEEILEAAHHRKRELRDRRRGR